MFSKDIHEYRRTPRSINEAFGPYSKLHVPTRKSRVAPVLWVVFYGVVIAFSWYAILLAKVA